MSTSRFSFLRILQVFTIALEFAVMVGLLVRTVVFFRSSFASTIGSGAYVVLVTIVLFGLPLLAILQACCLISPIRRPAQFGLMRVAIYFLLVAGILLYTPVS